MGVQRSTLTGASSAADLHGGRIREASELLGIPGNELLDFSASINFLGPTPQVVAAARRAVDDMGWYPLEPPDVLRRAAAEFLGVRRERVLLGNGGSELIALLMAHLRPRRVLVLGPTFSEYERAARAWGAEVDLVLAPETADFSYSPGDICALEPRLAAADVVFLCDPNNPTGHLWDRAARDVLVGVCRGAGSLVVSDESFLAFSNEWPRGSISHGDHDHVVVLHSLTKILAMPGLRIGLLILPPAMAGVLEPRLPPWNINCVAQAAGVAGLADRGVLDGTPAAVARAREALVAGLRSIPGVERVLPAAGNFLCVRLAAPAREVVGQLLRRHGILVRDLTDMPGMGRSWVRVAVRGRADNQRLLSALAEVLAAYLLQLNRSEESWQGF